MVRSVLKLFGAGATFALGFLALIGSAGYASQLSLRTGPQPAADLLSIINTLVRDVNTCCAPGGTGTPSAAVFIGGGASGNRLRLLSANSWTANGSVATTMTSLGPTGASTTVQKWLTIEDENGVPMYIPAY